MKQWHHAIADYSRAIELDPSSGENYWGRAIVYYSLQQYDKAWADVHKARSLGSEPAPEFLSALRAASGREG